MILMVIYIYINILIYIYTYNYNIYGGIIMLIYDLLHTIWLFDIAMERFTISNR
jgi:hypothetical protein